MSKATSVIARGGKNEARRNIIDAQLVKLESVNSKHLLAKNR